MIKKIAIGLLVATLGSCVTKVQVIKVYNLEDGIVIVGAAQQGSKDALNGNKPEVKLK